MSEERVEQKKEESESMGKVSNDFLIHLLRKQDILLKILEEKAYRFSYCDERISVKNDNPLIKKEFGLHVPMVSFSDVPFDRIRNISKEYGEFGLVMTKDWAKKNGITPVMYVDLNSEVGQKLLALADASFEYAEQNKESNMHRKFGNLISYMKNYDNFLYIKRDNRFIPKYVFYNEREWRIVPDEPEVFGMPDETFKKCDWKKLAFEKKLHFEYTDVAYIIVSKEEEKELVYNLPMFEQEYWDKVKTISEIENI